MASIGGTRVFSIRGTPKQPTPHFDMWNKYGHNNRGVLYVGTWGDDTQVTIVVLTSRASVGNFCDLIKNKVGYPTNIIDDFGRNYNINVTDYTPPTITPFYIPGDPVQVRMEFQIKGFLVY